MTRPLDTTWTHAEFGVLRDGRKTWVNIAAEDRLAWVYVWVAEVPRSMRADDAAEYPTRGDYDMSRGVVRGAFERASRRPRSRSYTTGYRVHRRGE